MRTLREFEFLCVLDVRDVYVCLCLFCDLVSVCFRCVLFIPLCVLGLRVDVRVIMCPSVVLCAVLCVLCVLLCGCVCCC